MIFQALEPSDAEQIVEFSQQFYPDEMLLEVEEVAEALQVAESEGGNFSVALVDQGEMCGYMLAWLEESRADGLKESVLLVDDVVLEQSALSRLPQLFRHLVGQMEESGLGHLAIEGVLLPNARSLFSGQAKAFRSLGYEMVASHDYYEEELDLELTWVRYERPAEVLATAGSEVWEGSEFSG